MAKGARGIGTRRTAKKFAYNSVTRETQSDWLKSKRLEARRFEQLKTLMVDDSPKSKNLTSKI
ncbi:MAG: hypothetical protein Roseis2KO_14430 [Roseivirga sp.]